ncbi:MAG: helix-turn-helix transcriptional regulator, partial [Candidatus Bathyarchaeia archaeon]
ITQIKKIDITYTTMNGPKELREWSSTDRLPGGFAEWLKDIVTEQEAKKGFRKIAEELGVAPSILSRWIAGMGPLSQNDIRMLASKLGPVVYTFLGIPRPDDTE